MDAPTEPLEQYREDWELAQRAIRGCKKAWHQILVVGRRRMGYIALKMTRDPMLAEDVVQTACVQILKKLHTYRGTAALTSWVARIVVNVVLLHKRKQDRVVLVEEFFDKEALDPTTGNLDGRVHARAELNRVFEELKSGRDGDLELFLMRFEEGLSLKQISKRTGLSIPALKSRFHRARVALAIPTQKPPRGVEPVANASSLVKTALVVSPPQQLLSVKPSEELSVSVVRPKPRLPAADDPFKKEGEGLRASARQVIEHLSTLSTLLASGGF